MGACCLLLSSLFFLFSGVSSRSSDKKTRPRQNKLLSTNLQTGRHHLLQAPDAHRGQQRRREDGEQQKEARKLKRKDGAREEKMKFPPFAFAAHLVLKKTSKKLKKTQTIIECLKQVTTGELPPNTRSGQAFIHDPRVRKSYKKREEKRERLFLISLPLSRRKKNENKQKRKISLSRSPAPSTSRPRSSSAFTASRTS